MTKQSVVSPRIEHPSVLSAPRTEPVYQIHITFTYICQSADMKESAMPDSRISRTVYRHRRKLVKISRGLEARGS